MGRDQGTDKTTHLPSIVDPTTHDTKRARSAEASLRGCLLATTDPSMEQQALNKAKLTSTPGLRRDTSWTQRRVLLAPVPDEQAGLGRTSLPLVQSPFSLTSNFATRSNPRRTSRPPWAHTKAEEETPAGRTPHTHKLCFAVLLEALPSTFQKVAVRLKRNAAEIAAWWGKWRFR